MSRMKMSHCEADDIRQVLLEIPPLYLKEMFKAFKALDASLSITIGENWLDRALASNIAHDLYSVMTDNLAPDERGVLRLRAARRN